MLWKNNLRQIEPYIPGEQASLDNLVKLNANENPYPPAPGVLKVLQDFPAQSLRYYPSATMDCLKEALALEHGVKKEQVFVGNGSDDVLALSFLAFFNSLKPILFPDITYSFYPVWCSLFQRPFKTVAVDEKFCINPQGYARDKGGVLLPNPNAPTGIGEGREFIEEILRKSQDCVVLVDEAYADFSAYSCIPLLQKFQNLLVVRTFSKSRSLAGARIGYAIGNRVLIETLEAIKNSYNSYALDSIASALGCASLSDKVYFEKTIAQIKTDRDWFSEELQALDFQVCPSQANFILVQHDKMKAEALFLYLKTKNIFVRYFALPRINNHLRITIGTRKQMELLLAEIKKFIELEGK